MHHHDPVQDCNQSQPIPVRITHHKPPKNLRIDSIGKHSKANRSQLVTSFFDYDPRTIKPIGTTTITNPPNIPLISLQNYTGENPTESSLN